MKTTAIAALVLAICLAPGLFFVVRQQPQECSSLHIRVRNKCVSKVQKFGPIIPYQRED